MMNSFIYIHIYVCIYMLHYLFICRDVAELQEMVNGFKNAEDDTDELLEMAKMELSEKEESLQNVYIHIYLYICVCVYPCTC